MSFNDACVRSRLNPNDECYTPNWFAAEVTQKYAEHLRGKTIFCPCDDPRWSGFAKYLIENFFALELRGLVCACYYPRTDGNMEQLTAIFHPERSRGVFAADPSPKHAYLTRAVVERNRTPEEKAFRVEVAKNVKFPTDTFGSAQKNLMVSLVETVEDITGPTQESLTDDQGAIAEPITDKVRSLSWKGSFEWTETTRELLKISDVVVTNPPFSKVLGKGKAKGQGLLEILTAAKKNFILIGNGIPTVAHVEYARLGKIFYAEPSKSVKFWTPGGSLLPVNVSVYSSFEVVRSETTDKKKIGYKNKTVNQLLSEGSALWLSPCECATTARINDRPITAPLLAVDEYGDYPIDYNGPVLISRTAATRIFSGCGFKIVGFAWVEKNEHTRDRAGVIIDREEHSEHAAVVVANAQTPNRSNRGYVYLVFDGNNRIKIGITRRSVGERLREIKTACPHAAVWDVSPAIEEYGVAEKLLHEQFKDDNVGGEWFDLKAYPSIKKAFLTITEPCKNRK